VHFHQYQDRWAPWDCTYVDGALELLEDGLDDGDGDETLEGGSDSENVKELGEGDEEEGVMDEEGMSVLLLGTMLLDGIVDNEEDSSTGRVEDGSTDSDSGIGSASCRPYIRVLRR
jgi:hypothetical protein